MTLPPLLARTAMATLIGLASLTATAQAAEYKIDPTHTNAIFRIKHINTSYLVGRFNTVEGTFNYDSAAPQNASIQVTIPVDSLDTNFAERNKHLKSPDFFSARQYPNITFKSTQYEGDANKGTLTGQLTLHGVTQTIEIPVEKVGEGKDPWGGYRAGFHGEVTIKRTDYGMDKMLGAGSDEVQLVLDIEGIRQ